MSTCYSEKFQSASDKVIDHPHPRDRVFPSLFDSHGVLYVTFSGLCVPSALLRTNQRKRHKGSTAAQGFLLSLGAWCAAYAGRESRDQLQR